MGTADNTLDVLSTLISATKLCMSRAALECKCIGTYIPAFLSNQHTSCAAARVAAH